jgi:quinoprotein glucose dehydrogenase
LVPGRTSGAVTVSGPIVTAGGLIFTGGGNEPFLRAFDAATGREMWRGALPVAAQSTPMTYEVDGRQFVVIAAGGHMSLAQTLGDAVVAFALPDTAQRRSAPSAPNASAVSP